MRRVYLILSTLLLVPRAAWAKYNKSDVIAYTKAIPVSKLDPKLSEQPLENWILKAAPNRKVSWEVNDCGESDGSGAQQDVSLCGAFTVRVSTVQEFTCYISVGSVKKGIIKNDPHYPHLFWCFTSDISNSKTTNTQLYLLPQLAKVKE